MKTNNLAIYIASLRQPIVAIEDTYLSAADEQNATMTYVRLMYQGKHFSGTIFEQGDVYTQLIEYQDGVLHGKNASFSEKGILLEESIYDNNEEISGKSWYEENGALKSAWGENNHTAWYEDGLLFYEKQHDPKTQSTEEKFYFRNGKVKTKGGNQHKGRSYFTCFFRDGSEIYTLTHAYGHTPKSFQYKHENCLRNYKSLLDSPIEADDHYQSEEERLNFIWLWLWRLLEENKFQFFEVVADMLLHHNEQVAQRSAYTLLNKGYKTEIIHYFESSFRGDEEYKKLILSALQKL